MVLSPPLPLVFAAGEALSSALGHPARQLFDVLSISDVLACLSTAWHERVAGRLVVPFSRLDRVVESIGALGLVCRRSRFDYRSGSNPVGGATLHEGGFVPAGHPQATAGIVYFGLAAEFLDAAEAAERQENHAVAGLLFGYPDCCTSAFAHGSAGSLDKTAGAAPDPGPFACEMNPALRALLGLRLTFHFPCSFRCATSSDQARRRRRFVTGLAPSLNALFDLGRGIAIYGPEVGVALVTRYSIEAEGVYRPAEVLTSGEKTAELFRTADPPLLRLRSSHDFDLGRTAFRSLRQLVAVFS